MNDEKPNGNGENLGTTDTGTANTYERTDGTIRNNPISTNPNDDNRLCDKESGCANSPDGWTGLNGSQGKQDGNRYKMSKEEYQEMRQLTQPANTQSSNEQDGTNGSGKRISKEEFQAMRHRAYNTMGWRRLRKYHLSQHPICEKCWNDKGIINPGTPEHPLHIHHIKSPFSSSGVDMDLLLDDNNLMTVCGECHGVIHNNPKVVNKVMMDRLDSLLPMD